ncbi:hypothetical protein ElyMa_001103200 [Elysia marginata]|uniref:Uncharacterized protein n=1 Tax=Elysia marginata TaxID=1093978 RepID=A0AAV4HVN0_9GAST|nr:hypothetical protein ElyMa_001103200 [Elysia marginata]
MSRLELSILAGVLSLLLASFAHSAALQDSNVRVRRSSADQRIAELQALLALSNRNRNKNAVAHGMFDPSQIGKKKRNIQGESLTEDEEYSLLRALMEGAAIQNNGA